MNDVTDIAAWYQGRKAHCNQSDSVKSERHLYGFRDFKAEGLKTQALTCCFFCSRERATFGRKIIGEHCTHTYEPLSDSCCQVKRKRKYFQVFFKSRALKHLSAGLHSSTVKFAATGLNCLQSHLKEWAGVWLTAAIWRTIDILQIKVRPYLLVYFGAPCFW